MGRITIGQWIKAGLAAIAAGIGALLWWGSRRAAQKAGEEIGRLEEDRARLHEADAKGDDESVLEEWRRSRQP